MGNTCDYTPAPVRWWRHRAEVRRKQALDDLINNHVLSEKYFDGQIAQLNGERLSWTSRRLQLASMVAASGEKPSPHAIEEATSYGLEIERINRQISKLRNRAAGVRNQLRELRSVNYNTLLQRNWTNIKRNYKRLDLDMQKLNKDADSASEVMEDISDYNVEHDSAADQVFSVSTSLGGDEEDRQRAAVETAKLFGLEQEHKQQPKRAVAQQPVAAAAAHKPATSATTRQQQQRQMREGEGLGLLSLSVQ